MDRTLQSILHTDVSKLMIGEDPGDPDKAVETTGKR